MIVDQNCNTALEVYYGGDTDRGLFMLETLAAKGNAVAATVAGDLYQECANDERAAYCYEHAARLGNPAAARELGKMLLRDGDTSEPIREGIAWLRVAAHGNDEDAMTALGMTVENGHGCLQDFAEAADWYARAADLGHAPAQAALGRAFLFGYGVEPDVAVAYFWLLLAVAGGQQDAMADRDRAANFLAVGQLNRAQRAALKWRPKRQ